MSKIVLDDVISGYGLSKINENFQKIENELNNKVLYRDNPVEEINTIEQDLDLNGFSLYNVEEINGVAVDTFTVNVDTVAENIDPINTVATNIANVNIVAGIDDDVSDVAAIANDVSILAPYAPDVGAYATGIYNNLASEDEDKGASLVGYREGENVKDVLDALQSSTGASRVGYQSPSGVVRDVAGKLDEFVSVKDFGAVGDGVTDDTTAIRSALASAFNSGGTRNTVYFPAGKYRITSSLAIGGSGVSIIGAGSYNCSEIYADFTGGPAVWIKGRSSKLSDMVISGNAAVRTSTSDDGILILPPDTSNNTCWFTVVSNVEIKDHGGNGILSIGGTWLSTFEHLMVYNCGAHGMRFDNGMINGRTNKANPGEIQIRNVMIYDNIGNGIVVGNNDNVSNRGFRFHIDNADLYRNALIAGTRLAATQMWAFFDSSKVVTSAFGCRDISGTPTTSGACIAGSSITIENTRVLDFTPYGYKIMDLSAETAYSTRGVKIDGIRAFNTADANLVFLEAGVSDVQVSPRHSPGNGRIVEASVTHPLIKRCEVSRVTSTQTYNNTTTPVDVPGLATYLDAYEMVQFKANILYRGDVGAGFRIQFVFPSGAVGWFCPSNSLKTDLSGSVVVENVEFSDGASVTVGTLDSNQTKLLTIEGEVRTQGTAGTFKIQASQSVAVAANTELLSASALHITRH